MHFILSIRSDFLISDSLSVAVHAFASRVLMSFFGWLDTASEVGELVYQFQRTTVLCGDVASLIKPHVFRLVCIDMETYASSCSFQTM